MGEGEGMNLNFGEALIFLKQGKSLLRSGWNGKNLCVYLYTPDVSSLTKQQLEENTCIMPHFRIWSRDGKTVNAWVPSVSDILSNDWMIKEE